MYLWTCECNKYAEKSWVLKLQIHKLQIRKSQKTESANRKSAKRPICGKSANLTNYSSPQY
jgi:hypothetical protein